MVLKASLSMQTDLVVKYDIKKRINGNFFHDIYAKYFMKCQRIHTSWYYGDLNEMQYRQ